MGLWNLKEFKNKCLNKGLDKAWFYTGSLAFKWNAVKYHRGKIEDKLAEMKEKPIPQIAAIYDYEIAFDLDCLMTTLNSIWDILGQLLNEFYVIPKKNPGEVCFNTIIKDKSIPATIRNILLSIKGDTLYATILAYANVSKHRHSIEGENLIDMSDKPYKVSYNSIEYEYNGKWYKLTTDKAFKCMEFVGNSVDQVGARIHELLK